MTEEDDGPGYADSLEWFSDGKCHILFKMKLAHPDMFFPEKGESTREGKAICLGLDGRPPCRILDRCREYAIAYERFGIWGGMSERERANTRKALRRRERLANKRVVRRPVDLETEWADEA